MTQFMDPITEAKLRAETNYDKGYNQGQRDQAAAVFVLLLLCTLAGLVVGGGIVGSVVAIF